MGIRKLTKNAERPFIKTSQAFRTGSGVEVHQEFESRHFTGKRKRNPKMGGNVLRLWTPMCHLFAASAFPGVVAVTLLKTQILSSGSPEVRSGRVQTGLAAAAGVRLAGSPRGGRRT